VDFLSLALSELSLLGATAEALRANIDRKSATWLQRDQLDPKFQVERVVPYELFFLYFDHFNQSGNFRS